MGAQSFSVYTPSRYHVVRQALFVEDATTLTHTATFNIPAGSTLLDIILVPVVQWTGGTAAFTCGDANAATGWFTTISLKSNTLPLGERLVASDELHWKSVNGSYLVSSGAFGRASTTMIGGYCPIATTVIGVVTVTTPATTVGRTSMTVIYSRGRKVSVVRA